MAMGTQGDHPKPVSPEPLTADTTDTAAVIVSVIASGMSAGIALKYRCVVQAGSRNWHPRRRIACISHPYF
jgi:hypothetical protein